MTHIKKRKRTDRYRKEQTKPYFEDNDQEARHILRDSCHHPDHFTAMIDKAQVTTSRNDHSHEPNRRGNKRHRIEAQFVSRQEEPH